METPGAEPSRSKRLRRWPLFGLAAIVTLLALVHAEEDWRGARDWRNFKREMEAKGESLDAGRLIPPKVPDDENFAKTPFFAPLSDYLPGTFTLRDTNAVVRIQNIAEGLPVPVGLPRRTKWHYGLAGDLASWATGFRDESNGPAGRRMRPAEAAPERISPAEAANIVLEGLKKYEPALAELQAASRRPTAQFVSDFGRGSEILLPHLAVVKGLASILSLRAKAGMTAGNSRQALQDIELVFYMSDGLTNEPLVLSHLVRLACDASALQAIGEGLAEHRWSGEQLEALEERLQKIDLLTGCVRALRGDLDLVTNPFFEQWKRERNPPGLMDGGTGGSSGKLVGRAVAGMIGRLLFPRGWICLEQLHYNEAFEAGPLTIVDLKDREINPRAAGVADTRVAKAVEPSGASAFFHHTIMTGMLLPAMGRIGTRTALGQSEIDMTMLACALERYRMAEGQYPEALEALVPRFVAAVPHDVINGKPLKYRRENGRFIIYSVGWNGRDDGGVVAVLPRNAKVVDVNNGDWVWEYPATN